MFHRLVGLWDRGRSEHMGILRRPTSGTSPAHTGSWGLRFGGVGGAMFGDYAIFDAESLDYSGAPEAERAAEPE